MTWGRKCGGIPHLLGDRTHADRFPAVAREVDHRTHRVVTALGQLESHRASLSPLRHDEHIVGARDNTLKRSPPSLDPGRDTPFVRMS